MKLELITKDMYGENSSNIYDCEKIVNNIGINYKYICENGIKNDIYFLDKKVLITRTGEITSKQVYNPLVVDKFMYKTPYLTTELEVKTLKYEKCDGSFKLEYQIFSAGSLLNEISIVFNEK